jgi:hypothetical protein
MRACWALGLIVLAGCGPVERRLVCGAGGGDDALPLAPVAGAGLQPYAHAHNDADHPRPLLDALERRFYSVEADLWFDGGRLRVGHLPWDDRGTLKALYLDPLAERVREKGSVHGDGLPFTLWIDLKDNPPGLVEALHALLDQYEMLVTFTDVGVGDGAVTAVLTGDRAAKERFVQRNPRRAARDSNDWNPEDPGADAAWRYYALDWQTFVGWNGDGALPDEARDRLGCLASGARRLGRQLRFYGLPDREEAWGALVDFGVPFIHTDRLDALTAYLAARR